MSWLTVLFISSPLVVIGLVLLEMFNRTGTATTAGRSPVDSPAGWVYFVGPVSEGPIKIGFTKRDPTEDRLPDLRTMSPYPLRILYKFRSPDCRAAEHEIHDKLASFRLHGEWFDRDVALAYISHLKGEH